MDVTTPAFVVDTTDGGATWTKFGNLPAIVRYDPNGTYTLNGISCVSAGGATWSQTGAFNDGGWLTSVSCASTRNCWAAGAASTDALLGTSDGGGSWSDVTSDTTNEDGTVSCLSLSACVAVTDNGLRVTSDDGGLTPTG